MTQVGNQSFTDDCDDSYYDAVTGRFTQRNPNGLPDSYAYCSGNSADCTDPTGLDSRPLPDTLHDPCMNGTNLGMFEGSLCRNYREAYVSAHSELCYGPKPPCGIRVSTALRADYDAFQVGFFAVLAPAERRNPNSTAPYGVANAYVDPQKDIAQLRAEAQQRC